VEVRPRPAWAAFFTLSKMSSGNGGSLVEHLRMACWGTARQAGEDLLLNELSHPAPLVHRNVLPALNGDAQTAAIPTRELFQQFAPQAKGPLEIRKRDSRSINSSIPGPGGSISRPPMPEILACSWSPSLWGMGVRGATPDESAIKMQVITGAETAAGNDAVRKTHGSWGLKPLALGSDLCRGRSDFQTE